MDEKKYKQMLRVFAKIGGDALKAKKLKENPNYYRDLGLKSAEVMRKKRKQARADMLKSQ